MNLYPQDLRDRLHALIIRQRAYGVYSSPVSPPSPVLATDPPPPRLGRLGRLWTRGMGLTAQEAATGLPAASIHTGMAQWVLTVWGVIPFLISVVATGIAPTLPHWEILGGTAAAWGTLTGLSMTTFPRYSLRSLYKKPLLTSEIDALFPAARDDISRAYLELIREAINQPAPPEAEASLRNTLRALGRAIDTLPPPAPPPQDTHALRQNAAAIRARVSAEQDTVIAASETRQADALERQAAALDRAATITRRTQVLRTELLAQIDALRAGLTDFRTAAPADTALLAALSEDIQRVADEATHVAQARLELETFVAAPTHPTQTPGSITLNSVQQ